MRYDHSGLQAKEKPTSDRTLDLLLCYLAGSHLLFGEALHIIEIHLEHFKVQHHLAEGAHRKVELKKTVEVTGVANILQTNRPILHVALGLRIDACHGLQQRAIHVFGNDDQSFIVLFSITRILINTDGVGSHDSSIISSSIRNLK